MEKHTEWKNPKIFRVNEMPDRAYFIPFSSETSAAEKREKSPYFHSLDGDWKFLYKESISKADKFFENGFDFSNFGTIKVPSCQQSFGFGNVQYQSSPYPFIFDPPNVPAKNPVGEYVREFEIEKSDNKNYELHFEGVDSSFYVWLNGEFIGYGECPHCDSSFDITPHLKNGKNTLCAMVLKWCSGSYIEDQDKIRLSGIFRSVFILERDKKCIRDFFVKTTLDGKIFADVKSDTDFCARIYDENNRLIGETSGKNSFELTVDNPKLWSAEQPYLYTLILHSGSEFICQKVGFRKVEVKNNVFYVNNEPIKLYGANRHDTDPRSGYTVDYEHIKRDLVMMKRNNINAIRCSHYPNSHEFYELCDELGFYVLAEADMECHGGYYVDNYAAIVDNPDYADAILDRAHRMVYALKNYTSIIIWSLGNESNWGENIANEAKFIRSYDDTRLVHYESIPQENINLPEVKPLLDVYSSMYMPIKKLKSFYENPLNTKPFVLCEYSHAMGNSCGDLKDYDALFESDARFMGGFIWEWCDHAFCIKNENGEEYYGYGGDFGDKHNLYNVCMDGLLNPDRVPHSSLYEAKAIFAPVKISMPDKKIPELKILNRNRFTDLSYLEFTAQTEVEGKVIQREIFSVSTKPMQSETVQLNLELTEKCLSYLTVFVKMKSETEWCEKGHEIARYQFELNGNINESKNSFTKPTVKQNLSDITICGKDFEYIFSTDEGAISSMKISGKELLTSPQKINCWRAPTDNDNTPVKVYNMKEKWNMTKEFGNIEYPEQSLKNITVTEENGKIKICGDLIFAVQGRKHIAEAKCEYIFDGEGKIEIIQNGKFNETLPYWLPRYGYLWSVDKEFDKIKYFGKGPQECYADKCSYAICGEYDYVIDNPLEQYEKPQECQSHCGTKYLTLSDAAGTGIKISGDFSFCASNYDIHEQTAAKHKYQLKKCDNLFLYIDFFMSGVGSKSVGGQMPSEDCRINPNDEINFKITVEPLDSQS
ncbi:MAG: glycoside hydrolase family 2 TIM barrel-domain containing protein [Clostridia bacterium]|nr:glycoside hydrolase family 2 TIM barrel-domain containing protein [Clostridia bacterium]